jgi:hypothetical protein
METQDESGAPPAGPPRYVGADNAGTTDSTGRRWRAVVIAVIVIVLLAVMLILHLTGTFGPGSNG